MKHFIVVEKFMWLSTGPQHRSAVQVPIKRTLNLELQTFGRLQTKWTNVEMITYPSSSVANIQLFTSTPQ
jgi:hypothetical protein